MKNQTKLPLTPAIRGEYLEMIKRLARDQFIQLEMGTTADFDKLWREAFFANGSVEPADET